MHIKREMSESVLTVKQCPPFGKEGQAGTKLSGRLLDLCPLLTAQSDAPFFMSQTNALCLPGQLWKHLEMLFCAVCAFPCASSKKFPCEILPVLAQVPLWMGQVWFPWVGTHPASELP